MSVVQGQNLTPNVNDLAQKVGQQPGGPATPPPSQPADEQRNQADRERRDQNAKNEELSDLAKEILNYQPHDYYKILGLAEDFNKDADETDLELTETFQERGQKVNPALAEGGSAAALDRVCLAARVLGVDKMAVRAVEDQKELHPEDQNMDGDDEQEKFPTPTKLITEIWGQAKDPVLRLIHDPEDDHARDKLDAINGRVMRQNIKEELNPGQWTINWDELVNLFAEAHPHVKRVKQNSQDTTAWNAITAVNAKIKAFTSERKYLDSTITPELIQLDPTPPPEAIAATGAAAASVPTGSTTQAPVQAPLVVAGNEQIRFLDDEVPKPTFRCLNTTGDWTNRKTAKGEKVLAHRPNSHKGYIEDCLFIVEKQGETNPIAFENSAEHPGLFEKYRRLEQSLRYDIRSDAQKYSRKDRGGFERILGVASLDNTSKKVYPLCAIWAKWSWGEQIMNRSSWRSIWGVKADRMIEDFFSVKHTPIPWEKRVDGPKVSNTRSTSTTSSAGSRMGRSSRATSRKRSSSVTSNNDESIGEQEAEIEDLKAEMGTLKDMITALQQRNV